MIWKPMKLAKRLNSCVFVDSSLGDGSDLGRNIIWSRAPCKCTDDENIAARLSEFLIQRTSACHAHCFSTQPMMRTLPPDSLKT